jgi:molybdate transport system substrate-binding protein
VPRRAFRLVAFVACLVGPARQTPAQDLTVAAAADLLPVLPALVAQFEKESGRTLSVSYGSSGSLFSQIRNGAPFDLFLSADAAYPQQLAELRLVEPGTLYRYAAGKIVLWARNDTGLDVRRGLRLLIDPGVRRVAIANPAHAPYGRAAVAALKHEQLHETVRHKLVFGENISQAAQFADSGNAEVGIIALSLALASPLAERGRFYEIPIEFYPPIEQAAVIIAMSGHKDLARRFLTFLKRPDTIRQLQAAGFGRASAGESTR